MARPYSAHWARERTLLPSAWPTTADRREFFDTQYRLVSGRYCCRVESSARVQLLVDGAQDMRRLSREEEERAEQVRRVREAAARVDAYVLYKQQLYADQLMVAARDALRRREAEARAPKPIVSDVFPCRVMHGGRTYWTANGDELAAVIAALELGKHDDLLPLTTWTWDAAYRRIISEE